MLRLNLIFLLFVLNLPNLLFGQPGPIKYGKISVEDLKKSNYDLDPEAEAVVLCDFGRSEFIYNNSKENYQYRFSHHKRIHILKKEGYKYADVVIPYYADGSSRELIAGFRAHTYNLINGKNVKTKISSDQVFDEHITGNWYRKKISFSDIKEGSIIEFDYTLISDFVGNLRDWVFQGPIPTLHSEYRATIPEFYYYQKVQKGSVPIQTEHDQFEQSFKIKYEEQTNYGVVKKREFDRRSMSDKYRWFAKDIPALREEPHVASMNDYYTQINFMLSRVQYRGRAVQDMGTTYDHLNQALIISEFFGEKINQNSFLKEEVARLQATEPLGMGVEIYNRVKRSVVWNNEYSIYPEETLRKAYNDHEGNIADINLILVAYLRAAGLKADPVILSTRPVGKMHPVYPNKIHLNYVLAFLDLGDQGILMDASDINRPFYLLPKRVMNGSGWRVSKTNPGWVKLRNNESEISKTIINLDFDANGSISASIDLKMESLLAYSNLTEYRESESDYVNGFVSIDWEVKNMEVKHEPEKEMNLHHHMDLIYTGDASADLFYFNPMMMSDISENPFKLKERSLPVDYHCPKMDYVSFSMRVPEGYVIDEVPENKQISLPNRGGRFTYFSSQKGNTLTISVQRQITQKVFTPEEYPILREFYNQIVNKCTEQIVVRKVL